MTKLCEKEGRRAGGADGRTEGRKSGRDTEPQTKMWGKSYLREMGSLAAWMSPSSTPARQNEG